MDNHSRDLELLALSVRTLKDYMREVYGHLKGVCDCTYMMKGAFEVFSRSILASMKCSRYILDCSPR